MTTPIQDISFCRAHIAVRSCMTDPNILSATHSKRDFFLHSHFIIRFHDVQAVESNEDMFALTHSLLYHRECQTNLYH